MANCFNAASEEIEDVGRGGETGAVFGHVVAARGVCEPDWYHTVEEARRGGLNGGESGDAVLGRVIDTR